MSLWEVSTISINTVSPDHQNISLFANGRHQIPVNVFISAKEKGSTKRYQLSPEELKSVQLIDFVTNEELTGDWTYSTTRNEFSHSISSMALADSAESPETAQNAAFDNKRDTIQFWISTTEIASKEIAASITSPEGIKSSTNGSHNYSSVIVTIKAPITYTTEDIVLEKHVEEQGSYLLHWMNFFGDWEKAWPGYWQTNHYVSLRNKVPLCKSENVGLDTRANPRLNNAFGYWASDGCNLRVYYIWKCGPETTKEVGVNCRVSIWKNGVKVGRIAHAEKDIRINQRPGMLCMTILYYACEDRIWWPSWYTDPCGFVIYDIHGNRGEFSLSFALDSIIVKS